MHIFWGRLSCAQPSTLRLQTIPKSGNQNSAQIVLLLRWSCKAVAREWRVGPAPLRPQPSQRLGRLEGWRRKILSFVSCRALAMPIPCPVVAVSFLPRGLITLSTERCDRDDLDKVGARPQDLFSAAHSELHGCIRVCQENCPCMNRKCPASSSS